MKKFLSILIVLLMICAVAFAEINLSSLSVDELIKLKTSIEKELIDRGAVKSANVPAGEYIIGTDIPAGSYSITTKQIMATIVFGDFNMYIATPDSPVGKVTLKDGQTFECSAAITLTKYAGLSFD